MKLSLRITLLGLSLSCVTMALADAPVVDLNDAGNQDQSMVASATTVTAPAQIAPQRPLTDAERVARLEQQMNNLTQMNMPSRIDQLQQQVQQLQGQLEMQTHQLQALSDQQKQYYQDLDQRLQKTNGVATASADTSTKMNMTASNTGVTAKPADEQSFYQSAVSLLTAKKYPEATAKLQAYLKNYPNGNYVANAHYWLGEIYFSGNKFDLANDEFNVVINQFPKDSKVPDARLKIAFIHANTGKTTEARKELQNIVKNYPETTAAQLASMRLKTL